MALKMKMKSEQDNGREWPFVERPEASPKCVDPDDFYLLLSAAFSKNSSKHILLPL